MELDLVLIAPKANPPVAKIVDYGKYRYDKKKKEKEVKKNNKIIEQKEIRLSSSIGKHDFDVKVKRARVFIEKGNRVKVSLSFRGREITNKEVGFNTINNFLKELSDIAQIDKAPKINGRFLDANISPKKK